MNSTHERAAAGSGPEAGDGRAPMAQMVEEGAALFELARAQLPDPSSKELPAEGAARHPQWNQEEHVPVLVIGAGQAGLSVGYHLRRHRIPFAILDAEERVGDAWRRRWDSLRLFTPAKFDALDGMRFPAPGDYFPTKDEMADYLETYARKFDLPVRPGVRVDGLFREGDRYIATAGPTRFIADHVVVAMSSYQRPVIPSFAGELDPGIVQLHATD